MSPLGHTEKVLKKRIRTLNVVLRSPIKSTSQKVNAVNILLGNVGKGKDKNFVILVNFSKDK